MLHRDPQPDLQASNSGQDLDQDQAYMGGLKVSWVMEWGGGVKGEWTT